MRRDAGGGKLYSGKEEAKIGLRRWAMERVGKKLAIDAFAGKGFIAAQTYVGHFDRVMCLEKAAKPFAELVKVKGVEPHRGDNRKLLPSILAENPSPDLVDLDAFGDPWEQISIVLRAVKIAGKMALVVTDGGQGCARRARPMFDPISEKKVVRQMAPGKYRAFAEGLLREAAEGVGLSVEDYRVAARTSKATVMYWAAILVPTDFTPRPKNGFPIEAKRKVMHIWATEEKTFAELAKIVGASKRSVFEWKKACIPEDWEKYKAALQSHLGEVSIELVGQRLAEQLDELRRIQKSAMVAVDSPDIDWNSKDAAGRVYSDALRAEQLLLERPTERHALSGDAEKPLEVKHSGDLAVSIDSTVITDALAACIEAGIVAPPGDGPGGDAPGDEVE